MRTSETRPRARQERFDAEFAKAVKGTGIEPRARGTRGQRVAITVVVGGPKRPGSVLGGLLEHGEGQDVAADAPAAIGDFLDQDHGVGPGPLTVDLGVQVGRARDDLLLLLLVEGSGDDLEVGERHGGSPSDVELRIATCGEPVGGQTMPPLARMTWPLTQWPAGEARKATTSAMSAGVPRRSSGGCAASRATVSSSLPSKNRSVAVGPGATVLTVTSRPRSSRARTMVSASTAPLLAL